MSLDGSIPTEFNKKSGLTSAESHMLTASKKPQNTSLAQDDQNLSFLIAAIFIALFSTDSEKFIQTGVAELLDIETPEEHIQWKHDNESTSAVDIAKSYQDTFDYQKASTNTPLKTVRGSLMDILNKKEAINGNYNSTNYKGVVNGLTEMSVSEVLEWQKTAINEQISRNRRLKTENLSLPAEKQHHIKVVSSAAGKYQFMKATLEDGIKVLGLTGDEKFTPQLQDQLAMVLFERRGLGKYLKGELSEHDFMLNLSQEWAALPDPNTGRSFYDKDGTNKHGISTKEFRVAVRAAKTVFENGGNVPRTCTKYGIIKLRRTKL